MAGDKAEVSEVGYAEGSSPRPTFGRRVLNHYKRWWWVHLIIIIVVVLVVTLPLYVLFCVIYQKTLGVDKTIGCMLAIQTSHKATSMIPL
jgi:uncharacterized membrane protein YdfJ with MMPL/SSD domain